LLPVRRVTYKHRPGAAGLENTLMRGGACSLFPEESHAGGRLQAGHTVSVATLGNALSGKWRPW